MCLEMFWRGYGLLQLKCLLMVNLLFRFEIQNPSWLWSHPDVPALDEQSWSFSWRSCGVGERAAGYLFGSGSAEDKLGRSPPALLPLPGAQLLAPLLFSVATSTEGF